MRLFIHVSQTLTDQVQDKAKVRKMYIQGNMFSYYKQDFRTENIVPTCPIRW